MSSVCYLAPQDLTDKINIWLNKSKNNVIADMTVINCKERKIYISRLLFWKSENRWREYKSCEDEFNIGLVDLLEGSKQRGYNLHIERLIEDYDKWFENYYGK
jgi:hypothetical protein